MTDVPRPIINNETENNESRSTWKPLLGASILILILTFEWDKVVSALGIPSGDIYNSLSALFSGLAFAGVIYAILLQRNELELQRKELRQTRKELERTAAAQELHFAPFIKVQLIPSNHYVWVLAIMNEGRQTAERFRLRVDKDVKTGDGSESLDELPLFTTNDGFYLPAGAILTYGMPNFNLFFAENPEIQQPDEFSITAIYTYAGNEVTAITQLNRHLTRGTSNHPIGGADLIVNQLERIVRALDK
jgi:hypothetical protein